MPNRCRVYRLRSWLVSATSLWLASMLVAGGCQLEARREGHQQAKGGAAVLSDQQTGGRGDAAPATLIQDTAGSPGSGRGHGNESPGLALTRRPSTDQDVEDYGLGVIGEIEPVTIVETQRAFNARVDTGARTSSIDAIDIKPFERDEKKWVRFKVVDRKTGDAYELERRIVRFSKVKQFDQDSLRRPVVKLKIRMGHLTMVHEFSLQDRNKFEYPVIIGRNILRGVAVVDVNRRRTLGAGNTP